MVLPAPVLPMTAVVWPAQRGERHPLQHRLVGPRVAEADVAQLERAAVPAGTAIGRSGAATDGRVSSTSTMRSAHTAARGAIRATNIAIITAMSMSVK